MKVARSLLLAGFVGLGGALSGCSPAVVGGGALAGAIVYARGDVSTTQPVTLREALWAAERALNDLSFTIVSRQDHLAGRTLVAWGGNRRRVRIDVGSRGASETKIRVRVDILGDEQLSRLILGRIRQIL